MITIAIDPGAAGGFAWIQDGIAAAVPMPDGMTAQVDFLRGLVAQGPVKAIVERVGSYRPGNSGPAAATFARHCGHIDAALYCLGIPIAANPTPQTWQKQLGTWPADKMERKRAIKEAMARKYPHLSVTLKTADALALLAWATEKRAQGDSSGGCA